MLEEDNRGSLACLCRGRKQQVGSGKAFFRSVQQTCFADRSSPSWKRINEWEGCFSFPPETGCQYFQEHPRTCAPVLWYKTDELRLGKSAPTELGPKWVHCRGPPFSSHLPIGNQLCAQRSAALSQRKVAEHHGSHGLIQTFASVNAAEMLF